MLLFQERVFERVFIVISNRQLDLPVDLDLPVMLRSAELNTLGMAGAIYRFRGGTPWRYDELSIMFG